VHILAELRLYREGLEQVLSREGLDVTGAAAADEQCVERITELAPEVVLLDMETPGSLALVRRVRRAASGVRVVALAVPDDENSVVDCAEAGVAGYVTRDQSIEDVIAAVESVARGEMIASPRLAATLLRRVTALAAGRGTSAPGEARLTPRELEIVALIGQRRSNKQIARDLCIEVNTVKNHVHSILKKLHVDRRADAAERVRMSGYELPRQLDEGLPEI
jgi:two-component system, NarL family, nitrate/nitrite response regulator NarL